MPCCPLVQQGAGEWQPFPSLGEQGEEAKVGKTWQFALGTRLFKRPFDFRGGFMSVETTLFVQTSLFIRLTDRRATRGKGKGKCLVAQDGEIGQSKGEKKPAMQAAAVPVLGNQRDAKQHLLKGHFSFLPWHRLPQGGKRPILVEMHQASSLVEHHARQWAFFDSLPQGTGPRAIFQHGGNSHGQQGLIPSLGERPRDPGALTQGRFQ